MHAEVSKKIIEVLGPLGEQAIGRALTESPEANGNLVMLHVIKILRDRVEALEAENKWLTKNTQDLLKNNDFLLK